MARIAICGEAVATGATFVPSLFVCVPCMCTCACSCMHRRSHTHVTTAYKSIRHRDLSTGSDTYLSVTVSAPTCVVLCLPACLYAPAACQTVAACQTACLFVSLSLSAPSQVCSCVSRPVTLLLCVCLWVCLSLSYLSLTLCLSDSGCQVFVCLSVRMCCVCVCVYMSVVCLFFSVSVCVTWIHPAQRLEPPSRYKASANLSQLRSPASPEHAEHAVGSDWRLRCRPATVWRSRRAPLFSVPLSLGWPPPLSLG